MTDPASTAPDVRRRAMPNAWATALARCAAGAISPQVALAQLLLSGVRPEPARVAAAVAGAVPGSPLAQLAALACDRAEELRALEPMLVHGIDAHGPDPVAATAALFDRLVAIAPEAAVALYALGDPALLDEATAELVAVIEAWTSPAGRDVLDLGCGIGRVAVALADRARSVLGLDVSPAMVAEARARAGDRPGLRFAQASGRDLAGVADASVDLILVADSLPFVVRGGPALVERHFAEFARVLRPGGDLLVFNWSYGRSVAEDVADAHALAAAHGFAVRRAGEHPFAIWDATSFHLVRT